MRDIEYIYRSKDMLDQAFGQIRFWLNIWICSMVPSCEYCMRYWLHLLVTVVRQQLDKLISCHSVASSLSSLIADDCLELTMLCPALSLFKVILFLTEDFVSMSCFVQRCMFFPQLYQWEANWRELTGNYCHAASVFFSNQPENSHHLWSLTGYRLQHCCCL
jgi:hypothetical protein